MDVEMPTAERVVRLLFRSILKREPAPSEVAANLAAVTPQTTPDELVALLRTFHQSDESRALRRRLDEAPTRRIVAPVGALNHVISLGSFCYPAGTIKRIGLKRRSYPFDWILSSPPMVLHCLRDDFRTFLDPSQVVPNDGGRVDHTFYRDTFGVVDVFKHRDPAEPEVRAYYERCVDRLRAVLASADTKLLVMASVDRHCDEGTFFDIAAELDRRGPGAMLLAVNINQRHGGNVAETGFRADCGSGPHRLLRFDARSPCRGLAFDEWLDDANFAALITQYRMELA